MRCLAVEADERFASALEVKAALEAALRSRFSPAFLIGIAVLVLLVAGIGGYLLLGQ
jgi:hypothetical protein